MPIIPVQQAGVLYQIFVRYGDTQLGRETATRYLRSILKFYYGEAYEYRFYGNSVDQNGNITYDFIYWFNYLVDSKGLTDQNALAQIESSGSVNITFLLKENPRYDYPVYYDYRIRPYSVIDRHEFIPMALQNLKFKGSKIKGTNINANSTETTDGGPVVKITSVNQNQIVFSNNNITTARANTSGLPVRQITSRNISAGSGRISEQQTNIPDIQA